MREHNGSLGDYVGHIIRTVNALFKSTILSLHALQLQSRHEDADIMISNAGVFPARTSSQGRKCGGEGGEDGKPIYTIHMFQSVSK